jgi:hypothetical protein
MNTFYRERLGRVACAAIVAHILFPGVVSPAEEPTSDSGEKQFLSLSRALTYHKARAGEGYFSPDGSHVIFQAERETDNPFYQIYMMSLSGGETHRVSPGIGKTTCAFFKPSTDNVIFASTHLDGDAKKKQKDEIEFRASGKQRRYSWDYDETFDIFSARRDGTKIERLTKTAGYDAECAFSPKGDQIVFCSMRNAYPTDKLSAEDRKRLETDASYFGEIYIMDADGRNPRRLTDWPGYDGGPFFSPDGSRIIWRHFDETGMIADVYTMKLDGSDRNRLTDFESMSWAPFYHPSGKYVVFTSNKLGFSNFELYIVDAEGRKQPVRATYTDGFDGLPVFSPDGRGLLWTSGRGASKTSQLFLAEWNDAAALAALSAAEPRVAGPSPQVRAADLKADVQFLASDDLEGRMTGSVGIRKAADHIVNRLKEAGIDPPQGGYLQTFPFTSGVEINPGENILVLRDKAGREKSLALDKDFRPLGFTAGEEVEGPVVFAGYGLTAPGDIKRPYDSYAGLDVKGKIVVALRYVPEGVDSERRAELNLYAGVRYKALLAREAGAKALLVVSGPNSPNAGELMPLKADEGMASSGVVVASITAAVADMILASADKKLADVQTGLDDENPHFEGTFDVPGVTVRIQTGVSRTKKDGDNIIGVIPPGKPGTRDEYVLIGAHYDHIGYGEIGSLARKGEEGQIHNGADDNASGTAVVLEMATALAHLRKTEPAAFERGIIVALWSGEELGLIGSSYFAGHPSLLLESIVGYMNFDMVGRMRENRLVLQGIGSSPRWAGIIEKLNVAGAFDLVLQEDPYLPTDASAFYPQGIPVVSFFTGSHEDYNRPTDDWQTLGYDDMERIGTFGVAMAQDLAGSSDSLAYAKVERRKEKSPDRGALRAYLGTIPDYATEGIEGVKLSGVRSGGPADKAGVLGGDIIVELGGRKILDIYDYTYALDAMKIGTAVQIVVLRSKQLVTLTVVPEARQ